MIPWLFAVGAFVVFALLACLQFFNPHNDMPNPNDNIAGMKRPSYDPLLDDVPQPKRSPVKEWFVKRIIKWFMTQERLVGLMQHGLQWVAAWLLAHHLSDGTIGTDLAGLGTALVAIIWSAYSGGKVTFADVFNGLIRNLISLGAGILVFTGKITQGTADTIIAVILSAAAPLLSVNAPEKKLLHKNPSN